MQAMRKKRALRAVIAVACFLVMLPVAVSALRDVDAGPPRQADRIGPVYPIIEQDWSTWLPAQAEKRLRRQSLTASRDQVRAALRLQIPNLELPEVKTPRTYTVDPSVRVPHPGKPPPDRTLTAGETLTPLTYLGGFRPIIIIDGRKDRHVQWARGVLTRTSSMIVLTLSGDAPALSARLGTPVYSAPPLLLERLSITRVPVVISQTDDLMRVEEVIP